MLSLSKRVPLLVLHLFTSVCVCVCVCVCVWWWWWWEDTFCDILFSALDDNKPSKIRSALKNEFLMQHIDKRKMKLTVTSLESVPIHSKKFK